jgi:methylenetetrahydrofolate reductase (NADPH)
MTNKFAQALNSSRFIVTAELLPPRGADPDAIKGLSESLPSNLDAIVVGDNPDEIRGSAISAAVSLGYAGRVSVILSMATRDRNRIALLSDALGAAALGISAIVCMSGNHQSLGICKEAAAANDFDSVQFTQALKKMVLQTAEKDRNKQEPVLDLQVGATAHPYLRPMELSLLRLKKKVAVGADFLLTQAVFDLDEFTQWMDVVREAGFDKRTAIIPSVLPLTDSNKARLLQKNRTYGPIGDEVVDRIDNAPDPAREGVEMAAEAASRLKNVPGVRGVHILSGGCESLAAAVIKQAGL